MNDRKPARADALTWAKFVLGAVLFGALLYVYLFVREFPAWLFGVPAILLGVDPARMLGRR